MYFPTEVNNKLINRYLNTITTLTIESLNYNMVNLKLYVKFAF